MRTEQLTPYEAMTTDEVCPCCEEEITLAATAVGDQVELTCRCGCSLAVA